MFLRLISESRSSFCSPEYNMNKLLVSFMPRKSSVLPSKSEV
uniref:Uncharacterized protein n=1 Tax=Arundo donax TaxID=35708 RepID=A0A0A8Y0P4_ARUDO